MSDTSLIYCSCWDPRNLGPRKLVRTIPISAPRGKPKLSPLSSALKERNYFLPPHIKPFSGPRAQVLTRKYALRKEKKMPEDTVKISPGFSYSQSEDEISVLLGDEMFERSKKRKDEPKDVVKSLLPRTDVVADLENQITELTSVIEQMNRDHQNAQKLLREEMEHRYSELQKEFENSKREFKETHTLELAALEEKYKSSLKMEKTVAQGKLEGMVKEYKYLKNMFRMYQDSIADEMEEKWSRRKVEWEKNEKMEREKVLLQQKYRLTKKFEVDVEEEKRKLEELHVRTCEKFSKEREEFMKQHDADLIQLEELQKAKEVVEEELQAQSLILESLNTSLYQSQVDLQKEKNNVLQLEQLLQKKLNEMEEKYKFITQNLTEENTELRHMLILKNEELFQERNKQVKREISYHDSFIENENQNKKEKS
ncbi:flagellum-associated coiled-coil domain-containing protein 1 [Gracilinanus agilis]|uniref:flagellum-associated coiled-coil domain-containing protein 1 n=1 Tax=Gracilinanus agilis TaxID=191870 RepID=UPI001CFCEB25|nr:flagellum-associated coiled-coil domain-containing protein 1 [Gracilinanus agilis]